MKKWGSIFSYILIFVLTQIAWFSLLGLWIYWYVSNYIKFQNVGEGVSPQIVSDNANVFALVSGLVLLVFVSLGMWVIFSYLNRQMNITKLYDNFIANVTHELKSPLSSIQLYLETLKSRKVPDQKQKEFIKLMLKDTGRLNNLINSILYLSGLEKKKTAKKYPHDYRIYIADNVIREIIHNAIEQHKISGDAVLVSGTAKCECVIDYNWLEIVIHNLVDNAIKYSNHPLKINIDISHSEKYFYIVFRDNGIGVSKRDQKTIFKKFHRIYSQNSPNVKGTGLGLYWVKEIIKYHGGKVSVFSDGINLGTSFKLELPIYKSSKKRYIKNLLKISKKNQDNSDENNG